MKKFFIKGRYSIREGMILFVAVLMILFFGVTIFTFAFVGRREVSKVIEAGNLNITEQTKKLLDDRLLSLFEQVVVFSGSYNLMNIMSNLPSSKPLDPMMYVKINAELENLYISNISMVSSMCLYLNDGDVVYYKGPGVLNNYNFDFDSWYERYGATEFHWLNIAESNTLKSPHESAKTAVLFRLIGRPGYKLNGIILINLKEDYFNNIFVQSQAYESSYFAIVDKDGRAYFNASHPSYAMEEALINKISESDGKGAFRHTLDNKKKLYISFDSINLSKWKLVLITPQEEVFSSLNITTDLMVIWAVVIVGVGMFVAMAFSKRIINPILMLVEKVKEVENGDLDVEFDIRPRNEIHMLNEGIGFLLLRIKKLIENLKEEAARKKNAELSLLQAQINPHFLYNTLYTIKQFCDANEPENASIMIGNLADFYRIGISRGKELITIREEIKHIESYLAIQTVRNENFFDFKIDIDPDIQENKILKLTLQPIIENAIYHGLKPLRDYGSITVTGRREGERIAIRVRDTGVGIYEEQLNKIRDIICRKDGEAPKDTTISYGLRNVNDRLRIHFGENSGLAIDSVEDEYTEITVFLPEDRSGVNDKNSTD